ncbi:5447_t:CDS:2, partial [Rhizophagus irregularis]
QPGDSTRRADFLKGYWDSNAPGLLANLPYSTYIISLNATEAPIIAISFHFPVPFYDIHKDWISECNIGPAKILTAAETNLIRSNPKEFRSLHLG